MFVDAEIAYIGLGITSWSTGTNVLYLATKAFSSDIPAGIDAYFLLAVLAGVLGTLRMFYHYAVVRRLAANTWSQRIALLALVLELIVAIAVTFYIVGARNAELLEALEICKGTDFKKRDLCIDGNFTAYLIAMNLLVFVICMLPFCIRASTYVCCGRRMHVPPAHGSRRDRRLEQNLLEPSDISSSNSSYV